MPTVQALQDAAALYNRQIQELTARIYEDGFVSCEEATEGTRYYVGVRPHLRRFHRVLHECILNLYYHHASQDPTAVNETLRAYHVILHDFDKLLNDSKVMLKIFADVLSDCPDIPIETESKTDA